jgi:heat shock protein HslJ
MDAAQLEGTSWDIVEIDGEPVLEASSPTLEFLPEGQLAGRATINRLMGRYEVADGALVLGPIATTMMAGPEDLMAQERRVLDALQRELRLEAGAGDDELLLVSDAGTTRLVRAAAAED